MTRAGVSHAECPVWHRVTEYVVNAIPEHLCGDGGCVDWYAWNVTVEWRGPDQWAVKHLSQCLSQSGKWDYEPIPSSRTEAWRKRHRFTEQEALRLAREAAHTVCVNGLYPADIAKKYGSIEQGPHA